MTVVGVDGCRSGWIAVAVDRNRRASAHHLATIGDVTEAVPGALVVGVDMPIGLPAAGRRRADELARAALGFRRSSIFFAPPRPVLTAPTHAEATVRSVELTGMGVSRQAFGLAAKILEVEAWLPSAPGPVVEVHPELSFATMLGHPAIAGKKTWAGAAERHAVLAEAGIRLDELDPAAGAKAGVDDVLDAAAAAWSALRVLTGEAHCLPDPPELGDDGRPMAIWC